MRHWTIVRRLMGASAAGLLMAAPLQGQTTSTTPVIVSAERAMVSRAELETALKEIEAALAGGGYSSTLRVAKQSQADAIRERLAQGDLRVGDLIRLDVAELSNMSNFYQVSSNRTITLPGSIEISVAGILRSELQAYMTKQLSKLTRDPSVQVIPSIRLSVFGAVGKSGFVNAPATMLLSDVIQQLAGGPANNVRWEKSRIMRGTKVVVDGNEFREAVNTATTIDQLNLQAGDVIDVAAKPAGGTFLRVLGVVGSLSSLVWLIGRF